MGAIPSSDLPGHRHLHERVCSALDLCQESKHVDFKQSAAWEDLRARITTTQGGVDLVTVMQLLGHADISTTMLYSHPSRETKRKAVEGLIDKSSRLVADGVPVMPEENAQLVENSGAPGAIRIPSATPGLGRRLKMNKKMIDMNVVTEGTVTCKTFALSTWFPFVSWKPNTPDP